MNSIVLNDGTVLKKGGWYRYTVVSEGLYTTRIWRNYLCKIKSISDGLIVINEPLQNNEYTYTIDFINNGCEFYSWWNFWTLKSQLI